MHLSVISYLPPNKHGNSVCNYYVLPPHTGKEDIIEQMLPSSRYQRITSSAYQEAAFALQKCGKFTESLSCCLLRLVIRNNTCA